MAEVVTAFDPLTRRMPVVVAPRIPLLAANALGLFRIALGIGLTWIALTALLPSADIVFRHYGAPDLDLIHAIARSPTWLIALRWWMVLAAVFFTVGLCTRTAYALLVLAMLIRTYLQLEVLGAHDYGLPLLTMLGWVTVRWGDGFSLDRLWWRPGEDPEPSAAYGFAVWWPGLTLGLALLSAAYTKLVNTDGQWITTGAVKYHFVTDATQAVTDWGLWIAAHHPVAVLASVGAIALEGAFIVVIFARTEWQRLIALGAAALLFGGLYVLQGIAWPPWWLLLLSFLPWQWWRASRDKGRQERFVMWSRLPLAQQVVALAMVILQGYATIAAIEREPFLSNFPMYSGTYASTQQFDQQMEWRFTRFVNARSSSAGTENMINRLSDDSRIALMRLSEQRNVASEQIGKLCAEYARLAGELPTWLELRLTRSGFDWSTGRFLQYMSVPTVPVKLAALCDDRHS